MAEAQGWMADDGWFKLEGGRCKVDDGRRMMMLAKQWMVRDGLAADGLVWVTGGLEGCGEIRQEY